MVNHLLETSHSISSPALCLCDSVADTSSILRTHFQVPYPVSPLPATLTKTPGVWGYSFHFGSPGTTWAKGTRTSFYSFPHVATSLPLPLSTVSSRCAVDRRAKAGDNFKSTTLAGVATTLTRVGAISEEEVDEHFSKHTDTAGIVRLRIDGDAAVDLRAVRRGDCRAGGAGLPGVYHGDAHERGPGQAAGPEQDPDGATGPGKFTHRGFEGPDGSDHAANGLDAIGDRAGQEPLGNDPKGAASLGPEALGAIERKRRKNRRGSLRSGRHEERHRSNEDGPGSDERQAGAQLWRHERDERADRAQQGRPRRFAAARRPQLLRVHGNEIEVC